MTTTARPNLPRLLFGGVAAGLAINAIEYLVHGMFLDAQWTAAFAALGKTPTGWTTFIPENFLLGVIAIWVYTRMRPSYGPGPKTAVRTALAVWVVFWVIPEMALQPLKLFPNSLLFTVIAVGLLDSIPAVLLGAWIYRP
ncbi:MAG: hypothetical protein ACLQU1_06905 [Bryobacteraceae bacterium]